MASQICRSRWHKATSCLDRRTTGEQHCGEDLTVATPETPGPDNSFGKRRASIGVQSILFNNDHQHVERCIGALARAAELAISSGACSRVTLSYGDCSPQRCLPMKLFEQLRLRYDGLLKIDYKFFGENRGNPPVATTK